MSDQGLPAGGTRHLHRVWSPTQPHVRGGTSGFHGHEAQQESSEPGQGEIVTLSPHFSFCSAEMGLCLLDLKVL